jgi:hypothetical protein
VDDADPKRRTNAGHNRDFQERERRFVPSSPAVGEAGQRGFAVTSARSGFTSLATVFPNTEVSVNLTLAEH